MNIEKYWNRLKTADTYIRRRSTGTPKEFARKMGICESNLYELLESLKEMGAPISYSRSCQSYYYEKPVRLLMGYYTYDNATIIDNAPLKTTNMDAEWEKEVVEDIGLK